MPYHSPSSSKNESESNGQLLTIVGLFLSGVIIVWLLLNLFVNTLITVLPPGIEQKLGAVIAPVYERQAQDSPQQKTLNQLVDRLETNSPAKQKAQNQYQVFYIPTETVNALAVPGNKIVIYQGLLDQVESENELMMVLGHELGHFANRDHLRGLGNVLVLRMTISYFLGDVSAFSSIITTSVQAIAQAQYSQRQEKQADQFGLTLLDQTYQNVAGATAFFERLSKKEKSDFDFLASHPASTKRVKEIKKLIKKNNYHLGSLTPLPQSLRMDKAE